MKILAHQLQHSSSLGISLSAHLGFAGAVFLVSVLSPSAPEVIDLEVIEIQPQPPKPLTLSPQQKKVTRPKTQPKAVFGQSRKAITEEVQTDAVQTKTGNTIAKEVDQKRLKETDPDSLPVPTEEYLVTQMPRLRNEVRIPYPPEAKKQGIEGPVVMDLLIDGSGKVREVKLIEGPGFGLNQAATQAIRKFEFRPAKVDNKPVAVRIRYIYRFVLER